MLDRIRALLIVIEEGSVNRAALRLRITQPALSRQMQALEGEIGGRLLERTPGGVSPTGLGHSLVTAMRPLIDGYDTAMAELRRKARGDRSELRIGYLGSAARAVLTPALERLRHKHPELKLHLHDLSPREQIDGLRAGGLDIALIGQEGAAAAREFHHAKLRSFGVCAALPSGSRDPGNTIPLAELKGRDFIGVDEHEMPGRNRWITALCRTAGFKPRFVATVDGITNVLAQVVSESAVTLLPDYFVGSSHPGVVFVPVADERASWDFIVLWQKGRAPAATRTLVEALRQGAGDDGAPARK